MRVASFDMTDTDSTCPSGLRTSRGLCMKGDDSYHSILFPVQGIKYSQVCGKIIGYQFGHVTDFIRLHVSGPILIDNINLAYVDGISLTHGSPREHMAFGHLLQQCTSMTVINRSTPVPV